MPLHSPGLRCGGLRCRLLQLGHGTGQFLTAEPDGGDRDEQGEQRDPRGNIEPTGKAGRQGVIVGQTSTNAQVAALAEYLQSAPRSQRANDANGCAWQVVELGLVPRFRRLVTVMVIAVG